MTKEARYIEPFGAPETFCTGAEFEAFAPGVVRVVMTCEEDGATVAKAKLLMPLSALPLWIAGATAFATVHLVRAFADGGSQKAS